MVRLSVWGIITTISITILVDKTMANYNTLQNSIRSAIKTNGNNEITGNLLQQILLSMVTTLGAQFQFAGVATQSTNPGTPDYNVAYLAGPGTYQNMGGVVVPSGSIGVIAYNGSWAVQLISVGGGGGGGSVVTFNDLPNGTTQILVDGTPQATIPSQYTLLKLSAFTTTSEDIANGAFYYNTSDKKIYQKRDFVSVVIPYYDGAIYTYNNALYVWNGTDLVNVGGGGGYTLPIASANVLGGIKVGNGLSIDANGVLSTNGGGGSFLPEPDDLTLVPAAQQGDPAVLKFANRAYNSQSPNGIGYKILRKDTTFAEQVTDTNTIYEIRYDFDLTQNFIVPQNSILFFNGGSIGGAYTINFNSCLLCGNVKIRNLVVSGKCSNKFVFPNWFGAKGDGVTNDSQAFNNAINACDNIKVNGGEYYINSPLVNNLLTGEMSNENGIVIQRSNVCLEFNNGATIKTILPENETNNKIRGLIVVCGGGYRNGVENKIENVKITGVKIVGGRSQFNLPQEPPLNDTKENYSGIIVCHADNVTIKDSEITDNPGDAIFAYATNNLTIYNCKSSRNRRSAFSWGSGKGTTIENCISEFDCQVQTYPNGKTSYGTSPAAILCGEDDSFGSATNTKIEDVTIIGNKIFVGNAKRAYSGPATKMVVSRNQFLDIATNDEVFLFQSGSITTAGTIDVRNNFAERRDGFVQNLARTPLFFLLTDYDVFVEDNIVYGYCLATIPVENTKIVRNNYCDFGIFVVLASYGDVANSKIVISCNETTATNLLLSALGPRNNKVSFVITGNKVFGTNSQSQEFQLFMYFEESVEQVIASDNLFECHVASVRIFMNKSYDNPTKLLFVNNIVRMLQDAYSFVFNGSPSLVKGNFIGNTFEFTNYGVAQASLGDFEDKMVFVNNTIIGATKITVNTETDEHLIYNNNIGVV